MAYLIEARFVLSDGLAMNIRFHDIDGNIKLAIDTFAKEQNKFGRDMAFFNAGHFSRLAEHERIMMDARHDAYELVRDILRSGHRPVYCEQREGVFAPCSPANAMRLLNNLPVARGFALRLYDPASPQARMPHLRDILV